MGNLNAEMIRQHPALAAFQQYIQDNLHRSPAPSEIQYSNTHPNDGIIELSYVSRTGDVFVAQIDASQQQALRLRHGRIGRNGGEPSWAGPVENRPTADACRTVQSLGGTEESRFVCPTTPAGEVPPNLFSQRASWYGQWIGANYTAVEFINFVRRWRGATAWHAQSPTAGIFRNARAWSTPVGANELSLTQRFGSYGLVGGAGAIAMLSGNHVSDMAGLHPEFHSNERFALNAYGAYGAMLGTTSFLNRGRAAGSRLSSPTLAQGLVSSALVDATLGQMWAEGSSERQAVRMGAFFLPQLYRAAFGNRTLALAETRAASGVTRWGGRAFAAGFYADAAYMIWDHAAHSNQETARSNMIYRRASQLQDAESNPFSWALHGAAEMVAPSLAQRFLTSDSYVNQATQELEAQSTETMQRLRRYLGTAILTGPHGPSADAGFYNELNWDWLREADGPLRSITRGDRELPLDLVAEHLAVPSIHRQVFDEMNQDQRIAYLQNEFRGYDLTRAEVGEILGRIALHNARQELRNLYLAGGGEAAALTRCFDEHGALIRGRENDLLAQIFPEQNVSAEQVLALRRVGLARRVLELRSNDPHGELAAYDRVSRSIGLIDSSGLLVGEESQLAQASLESHPLPAIPMAAPRSTPSRSQIILGIMAQGSHG